VMCDERGDDGQHLAERARHRVGIGLAIATRLADVVVEEIDGLRRRRTERSCDGDDRAWSAESVLSS
jgi:hypothetical protein